MNVEYTDNKLRKLFGNTIERLIVRENITDKILFCWDSHNSEFRRIANMVRERSGRTVAAITDYRQKEQKYFVTFSKKNLPTDVLERQITIHHELIHIKNSHPKKILTAKNALEQAFRQYLSEEEVAKHLSSIYGDSPKAMKFILVRCGGARYMEDGEQDIKVKASGVIDNFRNALRMVTDRVYEVF